ncbi:MAG: hypothetical protein CL843_03515 [Crocinitomicaceae bacterium]|nr:hypothetical protein [Crocinitomicaceae bacterium]|tara:strand:+ start:16908 stop:17150 length:243 start_codon:yes stop_codon:yes gene_type:complete
MTNNNNEQLAFTKQNYILLIAAAVLVLVGFVLMSGGGSDDPSVFSDAIFGFKRLTLAPTLVVVGYAIGIFAIMKKPQEEK